MGRRWTRPASEPGLLCLRIRETCTFCKCLHFDMVRHPPGVTKRRHVGVQYPIASLHFFFLSLFASSLLDAGPGQLLFLSPLTLVIVYVLAQTLNSQIHLVGIQAELS